MEPGGIEPPSTRGICGRIRRFRRTRSAGRSAGRTGGKTGRRPGSNGRPNRGTSPAHVAAERRGRQRPVRRRPGPARGIVGQPAARRAGRDRRGAAHGHALPLTPPDARQNRRNPRRRDAAGHRRPFRRKERQTAADSVGRPDVNGSSRAEFPCDARGNSRGDRQTLFRMSGCSQSHFGRRSASAHDHPPADKLVQWAGDGEKPSDVDRSAGRCPGGASAGVSVYPDSGTGTLRQDSPTFRSESQERGCIG